MASATLPLSIVFISIVAYDFAHSLDLIHNISLRSTLTAGSPNFKWVSPNGEFAFGFHSVALPLYSVGVWFDNISDFTFAWTAKTNDNIELRVESGSTLHLSSAGLHLFDPQTRLKWVAGPAEHENESVSAAQILNTGNFVLSNQLAAPIWQSFDEPTDTLLPGQTLTFNHTMFSKSSSTNFSSGRFGLTIANNGDLVCYLVERLEDKGAYWNSRDGIYYDDDYYSIDLKFDRSGRLYLVNSSDIEVAVLISGEKEGGSQFLRRVTLDTDGVLRKYVWNQMGTAPASWSHVWQMMEDQCKVKGLCGLNSVCRLTDTKTPNCFCPPGFDFVDRQDTSKGCRSNSSGDQSCSASNEMKELAETDWAPGSDYSTLRSVSESECMQACSDDCMCSVVTYLNTFCYKKRMPLIDGRQGSDITSKAFVKVTNLSIVPSLLPRAYFANATKSAVQGKEKGKAKGKVVLMVGIALVVCSSILAAATFLLKWFFRSSIYNTSTLQDKAGKRRNLKAFSYKEIQAATGGFRQEIGRGSFGKVYRGVLPNGRAIAVKALDKVVQEGQGEREFRTEVSVIGTSHHRNLVQLYGFCDESEHKFLVYQYMSNGSLDAVLFVDSKFLSWELRVEIAIGTARGILYLHEECATQIIHCDIKPQNILLDGNYNPKISDFGLAKLMKAEHTRTFTAGARGTKGYMAPEWHRNVAVTVKVDVYSFGVMLLEIICCRKTFGSDSQDNEILLCDWAYECFKRGRLSKLVEQQQSDGDTIEPRQVERMVLTALWCVQDDPALRPSIKKVVQMLEGTVEIAVPPAP